MALSHLPLEVLSKIFSYLPLDDRKNVRLTSKLCHDACSYVGILEQEKFVLHPGHCDHYDGNILKHLIVCTNLRSTIEFHGLNLVSVTREGESKIWKKWGYKIKSLLFNRCALNNDIIESIVRYCSNLSSLQLFAKGSLFSISTLDKLIAEKVQCKKLHTLLLYTDDHLPDTVLQKMFQIYPNIQTFGRSYANESPNKSVIELPPTTKNFKYMNALMINGSKFYWNSKSSCYYPRIRTFRMLSYTKGLEWMTPFVLNNYNQKLKELTLQMELQRESFQNISYFFSEQTELESIQLWITSTDARTVKELLFLIIQSSSKLRELKFEVFYPTKHSDLSFTGEECAGFLQGISRLELLDLKFHCGFFHDQFSNLPLMMFTKLKKLCLESERATPLPLYSEILKHCPSLQNLSLKPTNSEILKQIFTDHTDIRQLSLHFDDISGCLNADDYFGLYSPGRLRNLEYFKISARKNFSACHEFLSKFELSNLKYFHCLSFDMRSTRSMPKILDVISSKAPHLEVLNLDIATNSKKILPHCENMKKLKFLICNTSHFFTKTSSRRNFFLRIPSLLCVIDANKEYLRHKVLQTPNHSFENYSGYPFLRNSVLLLTKVLV